MLQMRILCDNYVKRSRLLAEHGLSLWIERNGMKILFDTGQTDVWLKNANMIGLEPESADAVVLSHGHYDHCGGLQYFPFQNSNAMVFVTPQAFQKKLTLDKNGAYRDIGMQWKPGDTPESESRIASTEGKFEILPGVWTLSNIGSYNSFESVQKCFFTEKDKQRVPDPMEDEQILVLKCGDGLAVFSGCSHRGVVNCMEHVRACFPGKKIRFLAAGMHLSNESEERLQKTIDYFVQSDLDIIVPLHCTGICAAAKLKQELGERCRFGAVGDRICLQ
ncbi:MAG: MBL fold metallo-hydrolase [Oscillospiraceae bacterium]|jgi:7,8-dihydropterin-6-yl-methyl-4-(beta-D-ribofuranosyl)aminobenzene 5'-phosphate synthase